MSSQVNNRIKPIANKQIGRGRNLIGNVSVRMVSSCRRSNTINFSFETTSPLGWIIHPSVLSHLVLFFVDVVIVTVF